MPFGVSWAGLWTSRLRRECTALWPDNKHGPAVGRCDLPLLTPAKTNLSRRPAPGEIAVALDRFSGTCFSSARDRREKLLRFRTLDFNAWPDQSLRGISARKHPEPRCGLLRQDRKSTRLNSSHT